MANYVEIYEQNSYFVAPSQYLIEFDDFNKAYNTLINSRRNKRKFQTLKKFNYGKN